MPKPETPQPNPDQERNEKMRASAWRDSLVLTEHPEYITAESNTFNDPDYPQ